MLQVMAGQLLSMTYNIILHLEYLQFVAEMPRYTCPMLLSPPVGHEASRNLLILLIGMRIISIKACGDSRSPSRRSQGRHPVLALGHYIANESFVLSDQYTCV